MANLGDRLAGEPGVKRGEKLGVLLNTCDAHTQASSATCGALRSIIDLDAR
jgi:hypothetical protein